MKKSLLLIGLIQIVSVLLVAQPQNYPYYFRSLDTNNISVMFDNYGGLVEGDGTARWELLNGAGNNSIAYTNGIWIVGKYDNEVTLAAVHWESSFSPGPIINGEPAMLIHPEDSLRYRVYKISKGDDQTNPDYAQWPVHFGAPVDEQGNPLVYGDQTLWTVYNSLDTNTTIDLFPLGNLGTMPLEIQQLCYSRGGNYYDTQDIFSNVLFIEWQVINKGSLSIDSMFIGLWADIDFDWPVFGNLPAIDTVNQLGYCWMNRDTLRDGGGVPPAVGYNQLYGPIVPAPGETAVFRGEEISDYRNLPLFSFHGNGSAAFDPIFKVVTSTNEAWNVARGYDTEGNIIIDPTTSQPTKFPFSGDPVSGSGWFFPENWAGDQSGIMFYSGPINLEPSDTQWVMIAVVPGLAGTNLSSIVAMRDKVNLLQSLPYDTLAFGSIPYTITDIEVDESEYIPDNYELKQNYPNPFNPTTTIAYVVPERGYVTIKIFDVLGNEITTLVNEEKPAGEYEVEFSAIGGPASSIRYPASGIYFYQLRSGSFIQTKKMILMK